MPMHGRRGERSLSREGERTRGRGSRSESASDDEAYERSRRRSHRDDRRGHRRDRDGNYPYDDRRHRHLDSRRDRPVDEYGRDGRRDRDRSRRERRYRERSGSRDRSPQRRDSRSRSPPAKRRRQSDSPPPPRRARAALPSQDDSFRGERGVEAAGASTEKQKPNYKPTGLLAKEANTVTGTATVLKYHEPPEARKPPSTEQWRMYIFKKKDLLDTIYLHQRSVWLFGRDQKVTDVLLEHPSVSKQHAVIQFRHITTINEYGDRLSKVKPYLIDLESANGTKLNGRAVEASRFVELVDGDVVIFGDSEREYVVMLPPRDT